MLVEFASGAILVYNVLFGKVFNYIFNSLIVIDSDILFLIGQF